MDAIEVLAPKFLDELFEEMRSVVRELHPGLRLGHAIDRALLRE